MINSNPKKAKFNQNIIKIALVSGTLILALGFAILTDSGDGNKTYKNVNKIKSTHLVNENDLVKSKWMGDVATDLDIANEKLTETSKENKKLKSELRDVKDMLKNIKEGQMTFKNDFNSELRKTKSQLMRKQRQQSYFLHQNHQNQQIKNNNAINNIKFNQKKDNNQTAAEKNESEYPEEEYVENEEVEDDQKPIPSGQTYTGLYQNYPQPPGQQNMNQSNRQNFMNPQKKYEISYQRIDNSLFVSESKKKDEEEAEEQDEKQKKDEEILPTGSVTKVMLLSGFDAPTMAQAKTTPLPILMKILDMSILPNKYKYDLKECFVVGEGYGDLSSERVYIRTNNISCMTKTGKHVDMKFHAMVSGEDGKVGLRGRVVTKQGALLARSVIAGFLDGISQAFNQSQQYTITGGAGVGTGVKDMTPGEAAQYGAFGGLSKASEKLAEFYLKMADQVSPVIEISAGRKVELITTEMTKFEIIEEQDDKNNKK